MAYAYISCGPCQKRTSVLKVIQRTLNLQISLVLQLLIKKVFSFSGNLFQITFFSSVHDTAKEFATRFSGRHAALNLEETCQTIRWAEQTVSKSCFNTKHVFPYFLQWTFYQQLRGVFDT